MIGGSGRSAARLAILALLLVNTALGDVDKKNTPERHETEKSTVVRDRDFEFQMSLEGSKGKVSVSTLKRKKEAPREMSVTIFTDPETSQTIELRALNLTDALPRYQGQLAQNVRSYTGFELRFETGAKAQRVLHSIPAVTSEKH